MTKLSIRMDLMSSLKVSFPLMSSLHHLGRYVDSKSPFCCEQWNTLLSVFISTLLNKPRSAICPCWGSSLPTYPHAHRVLHWFSQRLVGFTQDLYTSTVLLSVSWIWCNSKPTEVILKKKSFKHIRKRICLRDMSLFYTIQRIFCGCGEEIERRGIVKMVLNQGLWDGNRRRSVLE